MFIETELEKTYGYRPQVWKQAKAEALRALKATAIAEDVITYGQLTSQISAISFGPHESIFHHFLGQLSAESEEAGAGMISALVVQKGGKKPGIGFFALAKELGRDVSDKERCWAGEVKLVYRAAKRK